MRSVLRWVFRLLFLALAGGGIFAAVNFEKLLDRYAPLDLRAPPDWLTQVQLYYLRARPEKCFAILSRSEVDFKQTQLVFNDQGCGYEDGVRRLSSAVSYGGENVLRCSALASLVLWEQHVLQQAAQRTLSKRVKSIQTFGTYSCRNVNNRKEGRLSQHATANAIDVAGFIFDDGSSASVLKDWGKGARGEFLRQVRDGACRFFGGVLSPDYNAAHANHFHFDMGWWKICR
jgi:hypothetical protein